jgi:hypothetical protein
MSILGSTVKDKITGFTGIAIEVSQSLYSAGQVRVQPEATDSASGATVKGEWFDEGRIEIVTERNCTGFRLPNR